MANKQESNEPSFDEILKNLNNDLPPIQNIPDISKAENEYATQSTFDELNAQALHIKISINQKLLQSQQNLAQGTDNERGTYDTRERIRQPAFNEHRRTDDDRIFTQNSTGFTKPPTLQRICDDVQQNTRGEQGNTIKDTAMDTYQHSNGSHSSQKSPSFDDSQRRNFTEPTSTAISRRGGARIANEQEISRRGRSLGAGLEEFAKIYGIEMQANEQELKELENKIKEWKQTFLKSRELAEKSMNSFLEKSIQELQHSQSVFYADALPKAYAKFATAILTLVNLGYKLDQQNATKIQKILKIELNKDLVR